MNRLFGAMLVLLFASAAWGTALTATGEPVATPTEIKDLRGPFPPEGMPPFALTLLGAVAVGGAALTWTRLRRRRHPLTPVDPEPERDAVALLDHLAEAYRRRSCSAEEFCLDVAQVVREALTSWTGLPAVQLTTAELVGSCDRCRSLWPGELALAEQLLSYCDRVKFGGHCPDDAEVDWLAAAARQLLGSPREEPDEVS